LDLGLAARKVREARLSDGRRATRHAILPYGAVWSSEACCTSMTLINEHDYNVCERVLLRGKTSSPHWIRQPEPRDIQMIKKMIKKAINER